MSQFHVHAGGSLRSGIQEVIAAAVSRTPPGPRMENHRGGLGTAWIWRCSEVLLGLLNGLGIRGPGLQWWLIFGSTQHRTAPTLGSRNAPRTNVGPSRPLPPPESSKAPLAEYGCPTRTHSSLSPPTRFRTLSERSVIAQLLAYLVFCVCMRPAFARPASPASVCPYQRAVFSFRTARPPFVPQPCKASPTASPTRHSRI